MSDQTTTGDRTRKPRPSRASRRFGYLVAVAVNLILLGLVYVRPGWRAVGFLTEDATVVVAWFAASALVGIVINLIWVLYDPLWLRSLGDAVTAALGVVVLGYALAIFPFDVQPGSAWDPWLRVGLVVALVLTAVGVLANLVMVAVNLGRGEPPTAATAGSDAG